MALGVGLHECDFTVFGKLKVFSLLLDCFDCLFTVFGKVFHCSLDCFDCLFTVFGKVFNCFSTVSTVYLQCLVMCPIASRRFRLFIYSVW